MNFLRKIFGLCNHVWGDWDQLMTSKFGLPVEVLRKAMSRLWKTSETTWISD